MSACNLLFLAPEKYEYTLILLLTIPFLVLSPASFFDTNTKGYKSTLGMIITFGFSYIIFKLDTENLLCHITGTSDMLATVGWQHNLGAFLNCFVSLFYVIGVTVMSNSEFKEEGEVVLN